VKLTPISGRFWRAVVPDAVDAVLDSVRPGSAGRYHRPGQSALYMTLHADWAAIAVGRYMFETGIGRLIVPLRIDSARLVDPRDPAQCAALGIDPADGQARWRPIVDVGGEPPSWRLSDAARVCGADGLIDPSRGITGGWHVTLFRWNVAGAPTLAVDGDPVVADYAASRARWPAPPGWIEANGDLLH
jgi:hypothetical protein